MQRRTSPPSSGRSFRHRLPRGRWQGASSLRPKMIRMGSSYVRRVGRGTVFLVAVCFARNAFAQPVLLQIRPPIGDTLRMHLSQSVEMTGTTSRGGRDSTSSTMTTSIEVFTRAIAQQWGSGGTLMQSITDSVAMTPASPGSLADLKRRTMQARRGWVRVSTDGGVGVVADSGPRRRLRETFPEKPGMLARQPVLVGGE